MNNVSNICITATGTGNTATTYTGRLSSDINVMDNCNCPILPNTITINDNVDLFVFKDGKLCRVAFDMPQWIPNDQIGGKLLINGKSVWITRVLYNGPATIIFWSDDTKTIAKCNPEDKYNRELGFLIAFMKKIGNSTMLNTLLANWVPAAKGNQTVTLKDVRKNIK